MSAACVIFYLFVFGLFMLAPAGNIKIVYASEQQMAPTADTDRQLSPAKDSPHKRFVEIDFDNVDILRFVKFVSEVTGKNFVVDPKVKGKVTIVSPEKIPEDEVYKVFQSVLEVHGFTTLPAGSIIKIIPSSQARRKGVEMQSPH